MKFLDVFRELRRSPLALAGAVVTVALLVASFAVPAIADSSQDVSMRLRPPVWLAEDGVGLLGTDQLGRDLFVRLMHGVRASFGISISAVTVSFVVGTALGMFAGFKRGRMEDIIVRAADIQLSFPAILIAMVFVSAVGRGVVPLIVILGFAYWMVFARMARQGTLSVRSSEYVEASVLGGATTKYILRKHVFKNVLPALIGVAALEFARVMLAEAGLSFLGFGLNPPDVSLGIVLADGREYIGDQWWVSTFAGLVLTMLVLGMNLFGTKLQEALDPLSLKSGEFA